MLNIPATISVDSVNRDWDCIVVGGGPAGAMAARGAALSGLRTLIVERKSFPRAKVCGACVNRRALSVLESTGLGGLMDDCGGVPLHRFHVQAGGQQLDVPLPGGMAVSRETFDATLIHAAIESGAHFLPSTGARVLSHDTRSDTRTVRLSGEVWQTSADTLHTGSVSTTVCAKVVIAADGLGHPSLKSLPEFAERIVSQSRIGAGAIVDTDSREFPEGIIHMAIGATGYAGLVRIEDGRLNVAAAISPHALNDQTGLGAAVTAILHQAGFSDIDVSASHWTGTPQLTRSTHSVADCRVFVVGDAAGYVEPFTGEGIAWALAGGVTVAECAVQAVRSNADSAMELWKHEWRGLVRKRQTWCRRLAWLLRHPSAAPSVLWLGAIFPAVTKGIVEHMNSPMLKLKGGAL